MLPSLTKVSHWLTLLPILQATLAHPTAFHDNSESLSPEKRAETFFLRILPLGGSITLGWGSSTGNGYRKPLRDALRKDGWNVNMVGNEVGGTNAPLTGTAMLDNSVEAAAGYILTQIRALLDKSLHWLPNVVLINAGVNDCAQNVDIANIGTRMSAMLDDIYNNIPGTTVVLSTLLPTLDTTLSACHDTVNAQYRTLFNTRIAEGYKIMLADMAPNNEYWDEILGTDYYDATHPTDAGHAKLAAIWYQAINNAYARGFLTAPAGTSTNTFADDPDTFTSAALPPPAYLPPGY